MHVPKRRFVVEYRPAEGTECGDQNLDAIEIRTRAIEDAPRDDPDGVRARAREGIARVRAQR